MTPIRIPAPLAVGRFAAARTPESVLNAVRTLDTAELDLGRPISPLSVEDLGDRETVLAEWHRADKTLAATPLRPAVATEVLS